MLRLIVGTRYFIILPVIGLALAAATFFIFGGIGLIRLLVELLTGTWQAHGAAGSESGLAIYEVVEYVHAFLVGTVLYITAIGLFQLFIHDINYHGWLRIENTDQLETNLIGVTVVVLAVTFMGEVVAGERSNLLQAGIGIALVIAALGVFIGLRAWADHMSESAAEPGGHESPAESE